MFLFIYYFIPVCPHSNNDKVVCLAQLLVTSLFIKLCQHELSGASKKNECDATQTFPAENNRQMTSTMG